jgi:putative cardiolipin synthase
MPLLGCAGLPSLQSRTPSLALRDTGDTRLGRAVAPLADTHAPLSGVSALRDGRDAFAARVMLADAADRTLDVQYYIWHADVSGTLLLDALRRAAARGVRVRLLLDDNNTRGLDETLAVLAAVPNVEVRLFNPFALRGWRVLAFLTDFARLNRRMHNKSFTADNRATIVGGRNVGDEYFGGESELLFFDLDVLAVGPVVSDVSEDFDRYWNSPSSYPASSLLAAPTAEAKEEFEQGLQSKRHDPVFRRYRQAVASSPFVGDMLAQRLKFDWTPVQLVSDDPAKALGEADDGELMWTRLKRVVAKPRSQFIVSSAYFVPGAKGTADLAAMAGAGVKITVLTNSLEATDVPAVHAGYAKRRIALLRAGVALYELKRVVDPDGAAGKGRLHRAGGSAGSGAGGSTGSSGSSLHTKAFTVDGARVFIGSFNFDPRSARLNTEMGFVIDSPAIAQSMAEVRRRLLARHAYRVRLNGAASGLQWVETVGDREVVHDQEPGTTFWNRLGVSFLALLPIEWLL